MKGEESVYWLSFSVDEDAPSAAWARGPVMGAHRELNFLQVQVPTLMHIACIALLYMYA